MTFAGDDDSAGTVPATALQSTPESAASRADLPLTLLSAGYNLRHINAIRARFHSHAEHLALPALLWLHAQLADPCPEIARAAASVLEGLTLETRATRSLSLRQIEAGTGFARETLRRTARQLEDLGWMVRVASGARAVTPRFTDFLSADLQTERLSDFRWTAARIGELSDPAAAEFGATLSEALAAMRACRQDELPVSLHWWT